jgi:hypothetical protein
MLRRVALVRTDVSEELSASFIRVTRVGELKTMLDVTSNRRTLRRNTWPKAGLVYTYENSFAKLGRLILICAFKKNSFHTKICLL